MFQKVCVCVCVCTNIFKSSAAKKSSYFAVETTATLPGRKQITGMLGFCGILPCCSSVLESV